MTLALLLARAGLTVDLFERQHGLLRRGDSGCIIDPLSARVLAAAGCAGPALEEAVRWTHTHTDIGRRRAATSTYHQDTQEQHLFVPRWQLENALVDSIQRTPAIRLHYRSEFVRLAANTAHDVVLDLDCDGQRTTATYRFAVGCDGYDSTTRRSAGIGFPGLDYPGTVITADVQCEPGLPPARHVRLDVVPPRLHALCDPGPHGVWRLRWHAPAATNLDADVATGRFDHQVRSILGDHPYRVQWRCCGSYSARIADTYRRESVFLAGAAAHAVPPFGTDDLNLGLHDAANLAWKLAAIVHRTSPVALGLTYDTERRAAGVAALADARGTADFLFPTTPAIRLRSILTWGSAWLARRSRALPSFGPSAPHQYIDSPVFGRSPHPLVGRPAPDAPVVVGNTPGRLSSQLGPGFTFLVVGDIDPRLLPSDLTPLVVRSDWGCGSKGVCDVGAEAQHRYGAMAGAVYIIRPDGYVADVFPPSQLPAWRSKLAACGGSEQLLRHHYGSIYC